MLAITDDIGAAAETWLAEFEKAIAAFDEATLRALFHRDSHWRDVLALTWRIKTVERRGRDLARAEGACRRARARAVSGSIRDRTAPRRVTRAGTEAIEAIFSFETAEGRGSGVLRLTPDAGDGSTLQGLDAAHRARRAEGPRGAASAGRGRRANPIRAISAARTGSTCRKAAAAYADRDPAVLVVGGGQAGLSIAARLAQLQVDTLIVDREPRIGDNWRKRYHALTLHNQVHVNHLPYMPFPPSWPTYIPKDKLAGLVRGLCREHGAQLLDRHRIRGRHATTRRASAGPSRCAGRDGTRRTMRPRHVVMATGVSGIPSVPDIPTLAELRAARSCTPANTTTARRGRARRALVIGTGNSGHDIAQDLHSSGAKVTLVQRSPTLIVNVEPSAQLPYALYDEGPPLEDCDLITTSMPLSLVAEEATSASPSRRRSSTRSCSTGSSASASSSTSAKTARAGSSSISRAAAATTSTSAAPT